jgi:NADPH:quinone reductase-like Zn-dependent oxidoreductase
VQGAIVDLEVGRTKDFDRANNRELTIMPKVVLFHETGPADVLRIEDLPQRGLQENEVCVRVEAIGLNLADIMFRTGTLPYGCSKSCCPVPLKGAPRYAEALGRVVIRM